MPSIKINGKVTYYDNTAEVPCPHNEDITLICYGVFHEGCKCLKHTPECMPPYWDIIHIDGPVLDDEWPDVEDEAVALLDEDRAKMLEAGKY